MSDTPGPLYAIIAEMRDAANSGEHADGPLFEDWADRIDAAAKRERDAFCEICKERDATIDHLLVERDKAIKERAPGNAVALREALRECRDELYEIQGMSELDDTRIALLRQKSNAALAAPPRNCDVGTAEEQAERFKQFCLDNHSAEHLCSRCPLGKQLGNDVDMCQLHWAQMPYAPAQGGAKCVNGLRGEPDCRGCNEHCEDVRKRNCFYWNPDIEGGVCALTGKKSCPISCDNFHVAKEEKPATAKGGKE